MVDWLQISQVSGNSGTYIVTVTASSTSELTARTTSLTVTAHAPAGGVWTDKTETVSIRQKGTGELVVTPTVLNFVASGGSATIDITTYLGDWSLTGNDWLSFSQTTGGTGQTTVTVTAPDYSGDRRRIGSISITDGYSTVNVNVNQWGVFSVVPNSFTFPASGGTESFTVTSSRDWSITNVPAWITMSQVSGYNGTYTVTMTADTNTGAVRTGSFDVSDGYSTVNCSVSQRESGHIPTADDYLTFEILTGGTIVWNYHYTERRSILVGKRTIDYRRNGGNWVSITAETGGATYFNVNAGDIVEFRGENDFYGIYSFNGDAQPPYTISDEINTFCGSTATFNVYGNIMSLVYGDNFSGQTTLSSAYTFFYLFGSKSSVGGVVNVVSAENLVLPATTLSENCYSHMFDMSLLTIPPTLPASRLTSSCYAYMFANCASLTTAPILNSTMLDEGCYGSMFAGCSNIVTAPALPATTLKYGCYSAMFAGCSSLTTAPELSATTLAYGCYQNMFFDCSSLTTAPDLPAPYLRDACYAHMFDGCSLLTNIKCLAVSISALNCTQDWVKNVSSSGTFVKSSSMSSWTTGNDGIPNNWTVIDA